MEDHSGAQRFEEQSNQELASAAKGGDREARNTLFIRLSQGIRKQTFPIKRSISKSEISLVDEDDIDQQAFIIFCDLLEEWDPRRAPFVPYIMRMMRWRALHYVRRVAGLRNTHRIVHVESSEEGAEIEEAQLTGPDREIETREGWRERVDQLREEWRKALNLRFYHDLSSEQIARLSVRSRRTVDRELRAAMLAIRASIQDEWEGR